RSGPAAPGRFSADPPRPPYFVSSMPVNRSPRSLHRRTGPYGGSEHRSRHIDERDLTHPRRIPVTTVPRTLAAVVNAKDLAGACHKAVVRYGTTPGQVEAVLDRRPTSPAAGKLRRVIWGDVHVTLSKLE